MGLCTYNNSNSMEFIWVGIRILSKCLESIFVIQLQASKSIFSYDTNLGTGTEHHLRIIFFIEVKQPTPRFVLIFIWKDFGDYGFNHLLMQVANELHFYFVK